LKRGNKVIFRKNIAPKYQKLEAFDTLNFCFLSGTFACHFGTGQKLEVFDTLKGYSFPEINLRQGIFRKPDRLSLSEKNPDRGKKHGRIMTI